MGFRLHFETKHVVEYSCGDFNHEQIEIMDFLSRNDVTIYREEDVEYPNNFSCTKEEISALVEKLKKGKIEDPNLDELGSKELIEFFSDALERGEPSCSDIYFSWF